MSTHEHSPIKYIVTLWNLNNILYIGLFPASLKREITNSVPANLNILPPMNTSLYITNIANVSLQLRISYKVFEFIYGIKSGSLYPSQKKKLNEVCHISLINLSFILLMKAKYPVFPRAFNEASSLL